MASVSELQLKLIRTREQVLTATDPDWATYLEPTRHDVYHTAAYHRAPGLGQGGDAFLFVYEEDGGVFLWPYLRTEIEGAPGCYDATSVYGYAGPVWNDEAHVARGWEALGAHWRDSGVVSAFTRFHPLVANAGPFAENGRHLRGSTVAVELTTPSRYPKILRQDIRKIRERGFVTTEDTEWAHADDFVRHYRATMMRCDSRPEYLIDGAWVAAFRRELGSHARLFVTKQDGVVTAALLTMGYGPYLHAHLTGINPDYLVHSPLKILLDDVKEWGTANGFETFHLGGGLGGREDSLFRFKHRFSPVTKEFYTGSWILNEERYQELAAEHQRKFAGQQLDPGYFPSYRYRPEFVAGADDTGSYSAE